MSLSSSLYVGQVYHKRLKPAHHVLRYSVFSLLLDLSEIDIIAQRFWLFSRNRFNLLGFYDRDFGESANAKESLSGYVHRKLRHSGIQLMPARILLSCYPRVFGHVFNPLSLFYCLDENDNCYAVVHEVHNTFGERHAYVLPAEPVRRNIAQGGAQGTAKITAQKLPPKVMLRALFKALLRVLSKMLLRATATVNGSSNGWTRPCSSLHLRTWACITSFVSTSRVSGR